MRHTLLPLASFALCLCAAGPDWPQFRGPAANPVAADRRLPERWSKTENIEWAAGIPGRAWSSPIVTGGKVFVTTVVTDGKSKVPQMGTDYSNEYVAELVKQGLSEAEIEKRVNERDFEMPNEVNLHYFLYCLDLNSGKVAWKREFYAGRPPGGRHRKNSFASETPVTDGKRVYVYITNLGLYAFDLNGKPVWTTKMEAYPYIMEFGTGASPALLDDRLIIVNDNEKQQFIAAYDTATGRQVWQTLRKLGGTKPEDRHSGWATPYVWKHALRTEIVTIGPGEAVSYDTAGKELWRLKGTAAMPIPSPFAHDGLLYIDGGMGRSIFAVKPGGQGEIGEDLLAWTAARAGTYLPTPVLYDGGLYVLTDKGILSRYDARTGKVSYKARLDPEAGFFTTSPWAYNGKIFCLNEEGRTYVVQAGEELKVLGRNDLHDMAQATPAIAGDRLLLRTEHTLYSIRAK